ncbi:MAG: type II toxin-antitoxin system RelE/ParE family toxin [Candidatus Poribacteria bacterium]|nr:type II toxin-antitoxin system RelE/ParE family toxin [Candidatus Poribacteria bacterium]
MWDRPAQRDLRRLDATTRERVFDAMRRLAQTGEGDLKRLTDRTNRYRLRVGDWRVIIHYEGGDEIRVVRVDHRSRVYR